MKKGLFPFSHIMRIEILSNFSVQTRLGSAEGMSLTEFTYQVFQSYDWLHLYKTYNCSIQVTHDPVIFHVIIVAMMNPILSYP